MLTPPKKNPPGSLHPPHPLDKATQPRWGWSWPVLEQKFASLELPLRPQLSSFRPHGTHLLPWPRDCPLLFGDRDHVPSPSLLSMWSQSRSFNCPFHDIVVGSLNTAPLDHGVSGAPGIVQRCGLILLPPLSLDTLLPAYVSLEMSGLEFNSGLLCAERGSPISSYI